MRANEKTFDERDEGEDVVDGRSEAERDARNAERAVRRERGKLLCSGEAASVSKYHRSLLDAILLT